MGGIITKADKINQLEIKEYAQICDISQSQVQQIYKLFRSIAAYDQDNGVINYEEFCKTFEFDDKNLTNRLFEIFDSNDDKQLNFREFLFGMAQLIHPKTQNKIELSFKLIRANQDIITIESFKERFSDSVKKIQTIKLDNKTIDEMTQNTFLQLHKNYPDLPKDQINYKQFQKIVVQQPEIVQWLFLDLQRIQNKIDELIKNRNK